MLECAYNVDRENGKRWGNMNTANNRVFRVLGVRFEISLVNIQYGKQKRKEMIPYSSHGANGSPTVCQQTPFLQEKDDRQHRQHAREGRQTTQEKDDRQHPDQN